MPIRFKPGRSTRPAVQDDFFIPELCEAEALFTLVLLAELLVLVLVLAEPMTPSFNWVRLALASLFVQWIVLLSAALFCRLRPLLARLPVALAGVPAACWWWPSPWAARRSPSTISWAEN